MSKLQSFGGSLTTLELLSIIIPSVLGSGTVSSFATSWFNKRQTTATAKNVEADAQTKIVESIFKWADEMQERITTLEAEIKTLRAELNKLEIENVELKNKISHFTETE